VGSEFDHDLSGFKQLQPKLFTSQIYNTETSLSNLLSGVLFGLHWTGLTLHCRYVSWLSVSSVSHLLKRILCGPEREHLLEGFSLSVHENTSVCATSICCYGNNCLPMSLQWERLCPLPLYALLCERVYNCHLDNDTENLVTEPLSSNGRPLRFRYNPVFSGMPQYTHFAFRSKGVFYVSYDSHNNSDHFLKEHWRFFRT
jgi:hypothetical protein